MALVLPAAAAVALVPWRAEHARIAAIVLVVPVVAVAVMGAAGPAVLAALAAGIAYDVALTEPYGHLVIDDPDDVAAAVTLLAVGLVVGLLSSRLVRVAARDTTRRRELEHLLGFAAVAASPCGVEEVTAAAAEHIAAVLGLHDCRWAPGRHDAVVPLLLPNGNVMGHLRELNRDRGKLPARLELPARSGELEPGRFVLTTDPGRRTSYEERLTAATIATLCAVRVAEQVPAG